MLYITTRAGALAPVAGRRAPSRAAIVAPLVLSLLCPLAAQAADAPKEPSRKFGDTILTDGDDHVTNDKTVDLVEDVDFGGGSNALSNSGVITIGAAATAPVQVRLMSLEALKNTGTIDLRNGRVGDTLTLSGDYNGASKARLGLDVGSNGADKLVVGDVANGKTAVVLGGLTGQTAVLTGDKGPILIQAGAGSTANAFDIENNEIGFVRYGLAFDSATGAYRLKGTAGQRAYETLKISEGAANVWRQAADAWSSHVAALRDAGADADGGGLWGQAYGARHDRDDEVAAADRRVAVDYRQTTYGGQMGADLINGELGEDGRVLIGLTGGYTDARMRFSGLAGQDVTLRVVNVGGYMALTRGGFFVNALAKADRQAVKVREPVEGASAKLDGTSYGARIEAGGRSEGDGLMYEQLLSISYVSTRLDDLAVLSQRVDFGDAAGFVAKAGVRGAVETESLGGALTTYGSAFVVHDFTVKDGVDLVSGGQTEHLTHDGGRTFGQLTAGFSYRSGPSITFLEATGDYGGGHHGGGLRLGARVAF